MATPLVAPQEDELVGWKYIETHAVNPAFRALASVANSRGVSIREVARRCNRDHKNLVESLLSKRPRPKTIQEIGAAIMSVAEQDREYVERLAKAAKYTYLELERELCYAKYKALEGTRITGLVQRVVNDHVYVLLDDRNEGCMANWERCGLEPIAINDVLDFEVQAVKRTKKGPAILLSRKFIER